MLTVTRSRSGPTDNLFVLLLWDQHSPCHEKEHFFRGGTTTNSSHQTPPNCALSHTLTTQQNTVNTQSPLELLPPWTPWHGGKKRKKKTLCPSDTARYIYRRLRRNSLAKHSTHPPGPHRPHVTIIAATKFFRPPIIV